LTFEQAVDGLLKTPVKHNAVNRKAEKQSIRKGAKKTKKPDK